MSRSTISACQTNLETIEILNLEDYHDLISKSETTEPSDTSDVAITRSGVTPGGRAFIGVQVEGASHIVVIYKPQTPTTV